MQDGTHFTAVYSKYYEDSVMHIDMDGKLA